MSEYRIEDCSMYECLEIFGVPVYIFDDHSMALPAWGTCSSRLGCPLNLITFDSHTDTHPSFHSYVFDETGEAASYGEYGLKNPEINVLLEDIHYRTDDFIFEDIFKITVGFIENDEQILTGADLGYLLSYVVALREDCTDLSYEQGDRILGYNATYVSKDSWGRLSPDEIPDPIAVDFDLDFFGSAMDFDHEFRSWAAPLVKRAKVITIAREPHFFEVCRTDENYTNEAALGQLIDFIKETLTP